MASFPSSYIPTTTASATRAADVLTVPVSLAAPLSLFAEIERAVDTGGIETQLQVDEVTEAERIRIYVGAADTMIGSQRSGGATGADISVAGALAVGTVYRGAGRYALNDVQFARGGTLGTPDAVAPAPSGLTTIRFGGAPSAASPSFGYLRRAALWTRALTDAELQSLTT